MSPKGIVVKVTSRSRARLTAAVTAGVLVGALSMPVTMAWGETMHPSGLTATATAEVEEPAPLEVEPQVTDEGDEPLTTLRGSVTRRDGVTPLAPVQPGVRETQARVTAPPAPVATNNTTRLRALVVTLDDQDFGLRPWVAMLDRVGASYDVIHVASETLTVDRLVEASGTGRYNAVLLTSSSLLHEVGGQWVSGLDANEWNTLWAYERDFGVRQATLYASYGTWPEETCMRSIGEGGVDEAGISASLTTAGAKIFDYLDATASVPVQLSYVYRNSLAPECAAAEPVLTSGDAVLGVRTTTPDGREQIALTFSQNEHLLQSHLLTYGLFRWASRGMFLGEQRHYLKLDVDDYFNASDLMLEDMTLSPDGFRMTGSDAINMRTQQQLLRASSPVASAFRLTLAYNGEGITSVPRQSCVGGDESQLIAATRCVKNDVEWINHTYSHPKMNFIDYPSAVKEIKDNRTAAALLGLSVPTNVLKTGEYSGLGVYNPDVNDDIGPPTDYGLVASNPNLLKASKDNGVRYLHGNMSFASHVPSCFNCTIVHPMEPAVEIVPDWPTNIAYFSSTPGEETAFYNSYYGPDGRFPYWSENQTYEQILGHESLAALHRIAQGSMYSNTMHIPNLRDYGGGNTLAFDWLRAVVQKYDALYSVPLLSPTWPQLAAQASQRTAHFALKDDVSAIYNRSTGKVTVTAPRAGTVLMTGVRATTVSTYGTSVVSTATLTSGRAVTWNAAPLP